MDVKARNAAQCYIAAPSSSFVLQPRPRDPLLFVRLNTLKYYLLHKWGDDLHTADLRQGEVNSNNWNSPFEDRREGEMPIFADMSILQAAQAMWGANVGIQTSNSIRF